jgi:hypothetical protein
MARRSFLRRIFQGVDRKRSKGVPIAILMLVAWVVALAAPAQAASDLSGLYHGTGRGQATMLELTQSGTQLQGRFFFPDGAQGSLQGQWNGNMATGRINIPGVGAARFEARASGDSLRLHIFEPGRVTEAVFVRAAPPGAPPVEGQPTAPGTAMFFVDVAGVTVGPYSAAQLIDKLERGVLALDQPVRRSDQGDWLPAAKIPELQAAIAQRKAATAKPPPAPKPSEQGGGSAETPQEDEYADAGDPLRAAAQEIAAAGRPDASSDDLDSTAACLLYALSTLTPADRRQFLADIRTGLAADASPLAQRFPGFDGALKRLDARYPGLDDAVKACL